jgi:hypothetical protein
MGKIEAMCIKLDLLQISGYVGGRKITDCS